MHASCDATEPIAKIYVSLSSSTLTPMTVMSLIHDSHKHLKALAERQAETYSNLEPLRGVLQKADFHSFREDASARVRHTEMTV